MKRFLLSLFLVTIALIGICSVSAADADSVVVDNSNVALGYVHSIVTDSHVASGYYSYGDYYHPISMGDIIAYYTHDHDWYYGSGDAPVALDDCNECLHAQIGDCPLGWHHDRNTRG